MGIFDGFNMGGLLGQSPTMQQGPAMPGQSPLGMTSGSGLLGTGPDGVPVWASLLQQIGPLLSSVGNPEQFNQALQGNASRNQYQQEWAMKKKLFDDAQKKTSLESEGRAKLHALLGQQSMQVPPQAVADANQNSGLDAISPVNGQAYTPGSGLLGGGLTPEGMQAAMPSLLTTMAGIPGMEEKGIAGMMDLLKVQGGVDAPSNVREYQYWNKLPAEQKEEYLRVKRAQQFLDMGSGYIAPSMVNPTITRPVVEKELPPEKEPGYLADAAAAAEEGTGIGKQRAIVTGKRNAVDAIGVAETLLSQGIYSGFYGPALKIAAKAIPGMDKEKAARTEQFLSEIGNTVIPRLQEFGGNDSNEEMKYLQKVMGGDISMEDSALKSVLESSRIKIQRGIDAIEKKHPSANNDPKKTGKSVDSAISINSEQDLIQNPESWIGKWVIMNGKRFQVQEDK